MSIAEEQRESAASVEPPHALLGRLLAELDARPSPAAYVQVARQLSAAAVDLPPARLALLAGFTIDSLVPCLQVEAARGGFAADIYVAPFNSIRQELLDPNSGCAAHRPDVVFIAPFLEQVCPPLVHDFLALSATEIERHIECIVASLRADVLATREYSDATVIIHNFVLPPQPPLGIYEPSAPNTQALAVAHLNERLAEAARSILGVFVLDFQRVSAEVGYRNAFQPKMWYLARAPLAATVLPPLAKAQAAFVQAVLGSPRKCLVVDLDNTLWGGVIGEVGLAGIKLGSDYPGNVYGDVQRALLNLQRRGVLLAINSKNNPDDVEQVFRSHPDMILKLEHFAAARINWLPKSDNLASIAAELNIGLDSLAFLDDNPAECDLVRRVMPEVLTLAAHDARGTPDPLETLRTLVATTAFDRLSLTAEDRQRGDLVRREAQRRQLQRSAGSLAEFLQELQITAQIEPCDAFALPRIADLVQKTNQFNLTTRRRSAAELGALVDDPQHAVFSLRAADRFGDNGIVGAAIVRHEGESAEIDTFLLSCRVIGRGLETALLATLADWARIRGAQFLEGTFRPTAKNAPAADFYRGHRFQQFSLGDQGSRWRLDLEAVSVPWPDYVARAGVPATL